MLVAGTAYRVVDAQLGGVSQQSIVLDNPLGTFPISIGGWSGVDVPISDTILKIADNDDYLLRQYTNSQTGQAVNLYIAFSARPSTMRGHRPEICYPGNGWMHENSKRTDLTFNSGKAITCMVHRFHKPMPQTGNAVVLNYYILDGRLISNEEDFSALKYRLVNNSNKAQRYVTQVQISSSMANSVLSAASEFW